MTGLKTYSQFGSLNLRKEEEMPLRVGRQVLIGNGSSVALLGVHEVEPGHLESWEEEPGHWIYFVANIECERTPPSGETSNIIFSHARAIWLLMCHNKLERPHTYLVYPPDDESDWIRVMFRRRIEGKLRNAGSYLNVTARILESIWKLIHYAEYGGADENRKLTFNLGREFPIKPGKVNITKRTPMEKRGLSSGDEDFPLNFGSEAADKVAGGILNVCRARGEWCTFHDFGLLPGDTLVELIRKRWEMTREEYSAGLQYLIENEYFAEGDDHHTHFLREKFVVHCWRASLRL